MSFLQRCDTPNWVMFLFFLLAYMHTVLGEKLESMRKDSWDKFMERFQERVAAEEAKKRGAEQ